jgi:hypothetical protein
VAVALAVAALVGRLRAADGVEARITLPAGEITVGDPVILKLTVTHPPGAVFDYPDAAKLSAPAAPAEGQPSAEPDSSAPPRFLVEEVRPVEANPPLPGETSWTIRLRPFAPGDTKLPALVLTYRMPGSSEARSVATQPIDLHVMSVLKSDKEEPSDIRDPWWLPRALWPWIVGVLIALAALFAGRALWRRWRRRTPVAIPEPVRPAAPPEPAYDRARRELDRLLASGLLTQGRVKEFHVLLAEIVKRFLGAHFGFDALDRTTQEVLTDLERLGVETSVASALRPFLASCDLVKFAKHRPESDQIDATVGAARALIELGRPRVAEQAGGVAA